MGQTALDDDLFGEAASEMEGDVEDALAAARAALPDADAIWTAEADNVLGVLNGLKTELDADEARSELRRAKKWYTVGERADAFENPEVLAAAIEDLEATVETLEEAATQVNELTTTVPALRSALEEGADEGGEPADPAQTGL